MLNNIITKFTILILYNTCIMYINIVFKRINAFKVLNINYNMYKYTCPYMY